MLSTLIYTQRLKSTTSDYKYAASYAVVYYLAIYARLEIKRIIPNIKYVLSCVVKCTTNLVPVHQLLSGLTKNGSFFGIADLTAGAYLKP